MVPSKRRKKKKKGGQVQEKKPESTTNLEDVDDVVIDNFILRIKLPQAVKVLLPVAIFVVTNHACKYPILHPMLTHLDL